MIIIIYVLDASTTSSVFPTTHIYQTEGPGIILLNDFLLPFLKCFTNFFYDILYLRSKPSAFPEIYWFKSFIIRQARFQRRIEEPVGHLWWSITAWKVSKCVVFFWYIFSRTRTQWEDLRCKSPHSVQIRENADQKKLRIWTLFTQCIFLWSKSR